MVVALRSRSLTVVQEVGQVDRWVQMELEKRRVLRRNGAGKHTLRTVLWVVVGNHVEFLALLGGKRKALLH